MDVPAPVALTWAPRERALTPAAATAPAQHTASLVAAVRRKALSGAALRVVAGSGRVVVLGEPDDLPWCLGVRYLGWDAGLLVPTEVAPSVPADLLRTAAEQRSGLTGAQQVPILAVLPDALVFAVLPDRPVDVDALASMVDGIAR